MRGEDGQVGGIEGLVFGVLVFVFGTLVVSNAWAVIDAKVASGAAAREGTRAFVESRASSSEAALGEARAAAEEAIAGYGRVPSKMRLAGDDGAPRLRRCARVTLRVEYPVPLVTIPLLGRYGTGFTVVGRHSEIVDPYRGGLDDRDVCPSILDS